MPIVAILQIQWETGFQGDVNRYPDFEPALLRLDSIFRVVRTSLPPQSEKGRRLPNETGHVQNLFLSLIQPNHPHFQHLRHLPRGSSDFPTRSPQLRDPLPDRVLVP